MQLIDHVVESSAAVSSVQFWPQHVDDSCCVVFCDLCCAYCSLLMRITCLCKLSDGAVLHLDLCQCASAIEAC